MTISRRSLAETYEAQDLIIQAAQDAKREATKAYREQLDRLGMDKDAVKAEVEGFKKAFRRKMDGQKKGTEAVEHVDAIADEIYLEITAPAPRATRVANDVPHDADGVVIEPEEIGTQAPSDKAFSTPTAQEEITQSQAAPQPESDLTSPSLGQVATHPEAKTSTDGGTTEQDIETPADSVTGEVSRASVGAGSDAPLSFADRIKKLRPNCQQPDRCRSSGGKAHCWKCVAAETAGAA